MLKRAENGSGRPKTVQPGSIKFCMYIHAYLLYSRTGYDITSYFRSAFIEV